MNDVVAIDVLVPALVLAILGWVVPQLLAKIMPEGVAALVAIGVLSLLILLVLATLTFALLYAVRGHEVQNMAFLAALFLFGRAGLLSAIIWAPVVAISTANLPRHWTKETW
ncbi:hypothetical protein SAMN04488515_2101 [Cognatiyoonia koreensis]|uniref:Uncharacterized protein n=1 Tax=Cognatiyoonia koreensis TaxID=364200 RepID=A0A1I0QQH1_9RHOB|nr:hypothetical protein [Cognatiyoonia koreensis]SEW29714.1 hypothetical protein SAMN04488515_2101 [Cognatiyoonia koreensis]